VIGPDTTITTFEAFPLLSNYCSTSEGDVEIRPLRPDEHDGWLSLRERLWPDIPLGELASERAEILADPTRNGVLVAAAPDGLVGFVEVSIRDWAEGCKTRPVGYIEAWYVAPESRRVGLGRQLVQAAERWARGRGCTEMGSDAYLSNKVSRAAHRALGYGEVAQLVLFSKKLTP
jgi:aminoglycoside 6'-N-acetyltransferase I